MKKENFLIILPYWDSTFRNKNIGKLLKRFESHNHNIYIYCSKSKGNKDIYDFLPNVTLYDYRPVAEKGVLKRIKSAVIFLSILIKVKNIKVFWTYAGYLENLILSIFRIPFVLKSDSAIELTSEKKSILKKIRTWIFFEFVGKCANLILVETPQLHKKTIKIYKQNKVLYFPNGVNINHFKRFQSKKYKDNKDNKFFLCTGRMMHLKGIDLAIHSFALISKRTDWDLHFVGSADDENFMNDCKILINKYMLNDRVFFHPPCFGDDLFKWYSNASVFIMPSRNEGLANRLPEAMIFGNPVVAYDVGYTNALINDNTGFLIDENNFKSFGNAMLELSTKPDLRKKIAANNIQEILNNYDDDKIFKKLFQKSRDCGFQSL